MQSSGFLSGPLTDQFTKIVAGLKSTGLVSIADDNDPTAIRQEVAKKLYQYVSNSPVGQRSDAAQTLREASSPNPNVQILPALIKLTKDAVALDRIEAAMPNAFKTGKFEGYLKHKGTFPQSINEKAFTLDLEPEEKSAKLVDNMAKKLQSKNNRERNDAEKFFKSLRMAKEQGFYQ
jgi:HEAT repeat protein